MKKILIILAIVVLTTMAALVMTKPDRRDHYDALKGVVTKVVEAQVDKTVPIEELKTKATTIALGAADAYLQHNLLVYEETFYNKGIIFYGDRSFLVSIGIMGHVFLIFDENDVEQISNHVHVLKFLPKDMI